MGNPPNGRLARQLRGRHGDWKVRNRFHSDVGGILIVGWAEDSSFLVTMTKVDCRVRSQRAVMLTLSASEGETSPRDAHPSKSDPGFTDYMRPLSRTGFAEYPAGPTLPASE
jgi:hypothetical protein